MKSHFKFLCALLFSILCLSSLSASQKLYDGSSYEYRETRLLCQSAGVVGPSSALPVNEEELKIALDRIDINLLPKYLQERYSKLYSKVAHDYDKSFRMNVDIVFSPQLFITTDQKQDRKNFFIPYKDERALFDFAVDLSFSDSVYLESAMPLRNVSPNTHIPYSSFDFFYDSSTHIFQHMPIIARGSFGNDMVSLYLGRTRHSFGNGYTENMLIGDNFLFQEVLDLKFTSNIITYNISMTHFDTQEETDGKDMESFNSAKFDNPRFDGKQQNRVVHRFDINLMNSVRMVVNLGTLYYSSSNFDFRWFIPFMISHSYYNYSEDETIFPKDEANNIMSFEFDYPVAPKYNLSFQLLMDQFQIPGVEGNKVPNAFGGLLSFSYVNLGKDKDYEVFMEIGYTSPYTYLAPKKNGENGPYNWNYDYYLGYYSRADGDGINPSRDGAYSGFSHGPNSFVVSLGLNYEDIDARLRLDTILSYMVQGDQGKAIETFYEVDNRGGFLLGDITHSVKLRQDISYFIHDGLELLFAMQFEYLNRNSKNKFIPQAYLGISWQLF